MRHECNACARNFFAPKKITVDRLKLHIVRRNLLLSAAAINTLNAIVITPQYTKDKRYRGGPPGTMNFNLPVRLSMFTSLPSSNRLLQQFSETSLAMAATMFLFYIIRLMFPSFTSLVAIIPAKAVFLPWTFVTSAFLHDNFISVR